MEGSYVYKKGGGKIYKVPSNETEAMSSSEPITVNMCVSYRFVAICGTLQYMCVCVLWFVDQVVCGVGSGRDGVLWVNLFFCSAISLCCSLKQDGCVSVNLLGFGYLRSRAHKNGHD